MSLYNMVFGFNRETKRYLDAIKLDIKDIPRFRDTCLFEFEEKICLYIYTRLGANNRSLFKKEIKNLRNHPEFKISYEEDFGKNYAMFVYQLPVGFTYLKKEIVVYENLPEFRFEKLFKKVEDKFLNSKELNIYNDIMDKFELFINLQEDGCIENETGKIYFKKMKSYKMFRCEKVFNMRDDDDFVVNLILNGNDK